MGPSKSNGKHSDRLDEAFEKAIPLADSVEYGELATGFFQVSDADMHQGFLGLDRR